VSLSKGTHSERSREVNGAENPEFRHELKKNAI